MADIVRFGADAKQYFDVVGQMRTSLNNLATTTQETHNRVSRGTDDYGGFLKSEKAVKGQAKFLAASILQAGDAASAAEAAIQAFVMSTKVGLGLAVGAVAGFTAYKLIKANIDEATKAQEAFNKATRLSGVAGLGADDLGKMFKAGTEEYGKFEKAVTSPLRAGWEGTLAALGPRFQALAAGFQDKDLAENLRMQRVLADISAKQGVSERIVAQAKKEAADAGTIEAEQAGITKKFAEERKGMLLTASPLDQGLQNALQANKIEEEMAHRKANQKEAARQIDLASDVGSLQISAKKATGDVERAEIMKILLNAQTKIAKVTNEQSDATGKINAYGRERIALLQKEEDLQVAVAKAAQKRDLLTGKFNPSDPTGLFGDINKIQKDPSAFNKMVQQQKDDARRAQQTLANLDYDRATGNDIFWSPAQRAMFDAAQAQNQAASIGKDILGKTGGGPITPLDSFNVLGEAATSAADNLKLLSDLNLSGLSGLSGLTVIVQ